MKAHLLMLPAVAAAWLLAAPAASRTAPDQRALELVRKMDDLYRSRTSFGEFEMEISTPDWRRTLVVKAWTKGLDRMLIRILEPKKEAGVGTLRIGNEMWNYLPNTDKIIKIPPSMMMSSWMGSDFTNDDLVREFTFVEDFSFRMASPEGAEPGLVYVECRPKPGVPIVWDKIVIAVRESDTLPVWQQFFDERGRVVRRMGYSEVKTFGRRTVPSVLEMVSKTQEGHRTVLRYRDVRFDLPLEDSVFSLRNLRSAE